MNKLFKSFSIRSSILLTSTLIVGVSITIVAIALFVSFQNTTSQIVENTSKEINKQIILNFENYISSVVDTADYIQQKTVEAGLRDENDTLEDIYIQAAAIQDDIESVVLIDMDGNLLVSSSYKSLTLSDVTLKEWYMDATSDDSIYHFSSPHQQDIFDDGTAEVITVTKVVDYYIADEKEQAVLVVDINITNIRTLAETTNLGEGGHIVIINDDDSLIFSTNDSCDDEECESLIIVRDTILGTKSIEVENIQMIINVNTVQGTRWRMATFYNIEIITQTRNNLLVILASVLASTFVVTIFASSLISRSISSPINQLKDHMLRVERGEFYREIEINGQKEVVLLTHSFNSMIGEIRELMSTIVVEQKAKRKSEFQALQNQINPHFLYNTLDSIVYLSENKMNDKVIEMVVALSKFFRISISKGKNIILLREEIEHARNYLLIQQIRYNEKFDFTFDIDEEVLDCKVVKLSLQPIIENAIYHGISTEFDKGSIVIRGHKVDNKLVLEVEDNGYGIEQQEINELYKRIKGDDSTKSVGMRNVYQRLKIYYGIEADLTIVSVLDEKTIIRLTLPIERAE